MSADSLQGCIRFAAGALLGGALCTAALAFGQGVVDVDQPRAVLDGQAPKTPRRAGPLVPGARPSPQVGSDGLAYVWIPPGTFHMGCSPSDIECFADENPRHPVTISRGFWMGQTEVTVAAYKRFAGATGRAMPEEPKSISDRPLNPAWGNDRQPMLMVTWEDAAGYCRRAGGRLPTEAEWEYAARGGTTVARYGDLDAVAWYGRRLVDNENGPHEVGQKVPNGFGLYDMLGNAWEWVADWYGEGYYAQSPSQDPQGPSSGQYRGLRGGSWVSAPRDLRASNRYRIQPASRYYYIGFRCVREVP